eukprot:CAMPEP_0183317028 /NCGR_PEP_ID=MMETSP0160_2-20130417/56768_1 /TAXON_ID=2839 ORGANISM="Odontella Sinensis, Strain Grunow 1884" /NCGR_SAMPLE_ID=MMETSP0160_2 /ASSEMBLY_ACC=CAM_ASM_000250 /LENGTH=36 /DNA_ID= /DNA_START= /DNA_END= /DNA_ORIENTATION=
MRPCCFMFLALFTTAFLCFGAAALALSAAASFAFFS